MKTQYVLLKETSMLKSNSPHTWCRRLPACFATLSSLVLLLTGPGSTSVIAAGSSADFASVTIKSHTKEEIIAATATVFTADGYKGIKTESGQMVFDKQASRGTTLARDGIVANQSGERTINRVRVDVVTLGDNKYLLQCKAYMLTGGSDPFFQDEVPLAEIRKKPYQSLLKKIEKQLK